MKNGEFSVDTKTGVVVFCQKAHGVSFISTSSEHNLENFNVGVGQLIAMKRNEIKIRKADIDEMRKVVEELSKHSFTGVGRKLYTNFQQITHEKINASLNHIRELNQDLKSLYNGTYDKIPEEVKSGEKAYAIVNGSVAIVDNPYKK